MWGYESTTAPKLSSYRCLPNGGAASPTTNGRSGATAWVPHLGLCHKILHLRPVLKGVRAVLSHEEMYSPKPRGVAEPLKSTRARLARLAAAFSVAAISSPKYVGGWVAPLRGAGKAKDDFSPLHSRSRTFARLLVWFLGERRRREGSLPCTIIPPYIFIGMGRGMGWCHQNGLIHS